MPGAFEDVPDPESPMLRVLAPVHPERLEMLRAPQIELTRAGRYLAAVLCEDAGYPALSVVRVNGANSMRVGCTYRRDKRDWWFLTPDGGGRWIAATYDITTAAATVIRTLRACTREEPWSPTSNPHRPDGREQWGARTESVARGARGEPR